MEFLAQYIYAFIVAPITIILFVYLFILYRDPKRGKQMEERAKLIFDDEPFEEIERKSPK